MARIVTSDGVQVNLFLDLDSHNTGEGVLLYGPKTQPEMDFVVKGFRNFKTNTEFNNKIKLVFHSDVEVEVSISDLMAANPTSSSQYTAPNHSDTNLYFVEDDLVLSKTGTKIYRIDLFISESSSVSGTVTSVNNVQPDSSGNITISTGSGTVTSVNNTQPDSSGNVTIDVGSGGGSSTSANPNIVHVTSSGSFDIAILTEDGTPYSSFMGNVEGDTTHNSVRMSSWMLSTQQGRSGLKNLSPVNTYTGDYVDSIEKYDSIECYKENTYIKYDDISDIKFWGRTQVNNEVDAYNSGNYLIEDNNNPYNYDFSGTRDTALTLDYSQGDKLRNPELDNKRIIETFYPQYANSGIRQHSNRVFVKTDDGKIYGKGSAGAGGALGLGVTESNQSPTYWSSRFHEITDIGTDPIYVGNMGAYYGCLVVQKSDHTIWVCGHNGNGQLGTGDTTSVSTLTDVTDQWMGGYSSNPQQWTLIKTFGGFGELDNNTSHGVLGMVFEDDNGKKHIRIAGYGLDGAMAGDDALLSGWDYLKTTNVSSPVNPFSYSRGDYQALQDGDIRQVEWYGCSYGGIMVVTNDDKLFGWGRNTEYQLGLGHASYVGKPTELFTIYPEVLDSIEQDITNLSAAPLYANGYTNSKFSENDSPIPLDELPGVKRIVCTKGPYRQTYKCPIFIEDTSGEVFASGYNTNGQAGIGVGVGLRGWDALPNWTSWGNALGNADIGEYIADISKPDPANDIGYVKTWRRVNFPKKGRYWWDYHSNYTGPSSPSDKFPDVKFISPCFAFYDPDSSEIRTGYFAVMEDNTFYYWGYGHSSFVGEYVSDDVSSPMFVDVKLDGKKSSSGGSSSATVTNLFLNYDVINNNITTNSSPYNGSMGYSGNVGQNQASTAYTIPEFANFKTNHSDKHKLVFYTQSGNFEVLISDLIAENPTYGIHSGTGVNDYFYIKNSLSHSPVIHRLIFNRQINADGNGVTTASDDIHLDYTVTSSGGQDAHPPYRIDLHSFADASSDVYTKSEVDSLLSSSGGGFTNQEVFTTSTTWTVPAGVDKVKVSVTGHGGIISGTYSNYGGSSGSSAIGVFSVSPGVTLNLTVGVHTGTLAGNSYVTFSDRTGAITGTGTYSNNTYSPTNTITSGVIGNVLLIEAGVAAQTYQQNPSSAGSSIYGTGPAYGGGASYGGAGAGVSVIVLEY